MRNKKYRCWNLILILVALAVVDFVLVFLLQGILEKILLLVCGLLLIGVTLLLFSLYFEVKDDRIVTRLGVTSLYKEYSGSFKKHEFMFDDLRDIYVENNTKVHMTFKGGKAATFDIGGFNKKAITELIYEIQAQIKVDQ